MPFNVGPMELIIVLVIALLILGPGKLPEVGAAFGKTIREFRKASSDIQETANLATSPSAPATPAAQAAATTQAPGIAQAAPATLVAATAEATTVSQAAAAPGGADTVAPSTAETSAQDEPALLGTPADPVEDRA